MLKMRLLITVMIFVQTGYTQQPAPQEDTFPSRTLDSVTFSLRKPALIRQLPDRMVINIESSILAEGNTAFELLEKAPGVSIDDEGNISMKGKQGVKIMINGRLNYLSQKELTTLLKGLPSGSISQLELITQPSAKYDAAGNAGIINIKMKQTQKTGMNGTVYGNYGRGQDHRTAWGINLNNRTEKINVYGSYDYGYRGEKESFHFLRNFYDGQIVHSPQRVSRQNTYTDEPLNTHNFKGGADIYADSKNTFGVLVNGSAGTYKNYSDADNLITDFEKQFISDARTNNTNKEHWLNISGNINYTHLFDSNGKEFTADIDYSYASFGADQLLNTGFLDKDGNPSGISLRRGDIPSHTNVYVVKADYVHPLRNKATIETGIKSSYVKADNDARYDTLLNGQWVSDAHSTNRFIYTEQIHAGYINFKKKFGEISVQAGVRAEYTQTEGDQVTTDSVVNRNYMQLFPSLFIGKALDNNHRLQLSYSRRIERPDYGDLNPFRFFRDPYLYFEGNSFLQPELIHSFEVSHTFKNRLTTALSYSYTSNAITWIMSQTDSINTTFVAPRNIRSYVNYGLSFTSVLPVTTWWSSNNFFNIFYNEYNGEVLGGQVQNGMLSYTFNTQHTLQFRRGFSAELSGLYESRSVYGAFVKRSSWLVSAGVQQQVMKKKAMIKLAATDVFRSKRFNRKARYENVDMQEWARLDSRIVTLSFSYKFGKSATGARERKTGSEDINNRVKGGG